jgi:hypothetical protein
LPPLPPLPARPLAPVDPERLPIMYLGDVDDYGYPPTNYTLACRFQTVAIINSYCWNAHSNATAHARCTNHTAEFEYIVNQSRAMQQQCPGVLTQMYLNSMMNFWWYTSMYKHFDPAQGGDSSLLLHDVHGKLVRVLQDGGNPNMKNRVEKFLQKIRPKVQNRLFLDFFLSRFWAFLGEGSSKTR